MIASHFVLALTLHADPLENLIETEKQDREAWEDQGGELPELYLWGDKTGIALEPCDEIPFDELVEISRGKPSAKESELNLDIPRVREALESGCLFRPGDVFMAVGNGEQKHVMIKKLVVRRTPGPALWGIFLEQLADDPLFFATHADWIEGPNQAVPLTEQPAIKKDEDFDSATIVLGAPNAERLEILRRRNPTPDDDQLPNEILLRHLNGHVETVWSERVDAKKGSGRIRAGLAMDYNADGFIDLIVTGSHEKRPYRLILEGKEDGFLMKNVTLF